jgi:hypothetical protein
LSETLSDNDISRIASRIAAVFANFPKLPKLEQKLMLHKYVERINLSYGLPLSLPQSQPYGSQPEATALATATADEWARNVMDFVNGGKPKPVLEFVMKPGSPNPYVVNNLTRTTSETLCPGS